MLVSYTCWPNTNLPVFVALAFAARQERPMVCSTIADMIGKIESVISTDEILDKLENRKPGDSGIFDSWFNTDE